MSFKQEATKPGKYRGKENISWILGFLLQDRHAQTLIFVVRFSPIKVSSAAQAE
jgi:hypothetical protein